MSEPIPGFYIENGEVKAWTPETLAAHYKKLEKRIPDFMERLKAENERLENEREGP